MDNNLNENKVRKGYVQSDNSDFFAKWGSRNPELTISEEIDNQLASNPTYATINIMNGPGKFCNIETYNDGITPNHERMERMKCIGKSQTDKRGASVCGVGQIGSLVAGRKKTNSNSKLTFTSIHDGQESIFVCYANGSTFDLITENSGPFETDEKDRVHKIFENMRDFDDEQMEKIKLLAGVKIYPYSKEHPDFVFKMNNEIIKPIDILYEGVEDETLQRMPIEEYNISLHNKNYKIKVGGVYVSDYVKPKGNSIDLTHANAWDAKHNLSPESSGVFVELGGSMVICGGINSWKLIGKNAHSTKNGMYFYISIPCDGELKELLFAESPNKSTVSIPFNEITDNDGRVVFEELLNKIDNTISEWRKNNNIVKDGKKSISKKEGEKYYNTIVKNDSIRTHFLLFMANLTQEQKNVILRKKLNTVYNDIYAYDSKKVVETEKIIEEVKTQCYAT